MRIKIRKFTFLSFYLCKYNNWGCNMQENNKEKQIVDKATEKQLITLKRNKI